MKLILNEVYIDLLKLVNYYRISVGVSAARLRACCLLMLIVDRDRSSSATGRFPLKSCACECVRVVWSG